ncbi:hypothetical protein TNCV_4130551 [Trichonephila clavipes]|nr:hypothetical protein TNCV_4130551 [Trichonephila clavipes]
MQFKCSPKQPRPVTKRGEGPSHFIVVYPVQYPSPFRPVLAFNFVQYHDWEQSTSAADLSRVNILISSLWWRRNNLIGRWYVERGRGYEALGYEVKVVKKSISPSWNG